MRARRLPLAAGLALLLAACNSPSVTTAPSVALGSANPPSAGSTAATSSPTGPPPSPGPTRPPGALAVPTRFGVELEPGTYFSSPPFEIPFTFDVAARSWKAGHLIDEFFDLQQFEGEPGVNLPDRLVGFGHPDAFHGPDGEVAASALTPRAAIDLIAAQEDLVATNLRGVEIAGEGGARVDLHSAIDNNHVFGGDHGDFGIGPELDVRLAVIPFEDTLLVLLLSAPPGELGEAWDEAIGILDSIAALP